MFRIREITYARNCVFHCVHKEIDNAFSPGDNYSFHESDLQITLRLLSSSLGNTVLLHTLFVFKNNKEILLELADFALQEQPEHS